MAPTVRSKRPASTNTDSPQKRAKLLDDDESDSETANGVLKINEEYAARFKHNKERAELHRLEEKYGASRGDESEGSSTDDGTEDEDGELADENVDAEISATLNAIRSKDPRIYSAEAQFYTETVVPSGSAAEAKAKPVFLRDYHRQNLLGSAGQIAEDEPQTYVQEQASIKRRLVQDIHAATAGDANGDDSSDGDDFLVKKTKKIKSKPERAPLPDPRTAEKDPSTFLSNFFAARAWVPDEKSEFQPLESDDEDEDAKAEELEYAWNLRFEDPEISNKTLTSHSRDIVAKYSVRRDDVTGRKKVREQEKEKKLRERSEREEDKKRYKNLKIREIEQKLSKIKEAAGLEGRNINIDDWTDLLDGDWDDDAWTREMTRRFGEEYYAQHDGTHDEQSKSNVRVRKPHWDDDIDIDDIDPDFERDDAEVVEEDGEDGTGENKPRKRPRKAASKTLSRRDRRIIEALAEQDLPLAMVDKSGSIQPFRYRETSPNTFGLTPLDILAAEDAQLNQFVGLKKLASFRDPERKKLDKKKLSKKARLRAWRKETFGREEGPDPDAFAAANMPNGVGPAEPSEQADAGRPSGSKRKRKKKPKAEQGLEARIP